MASATRVTVNAKAREAMDEAEGNITLAAKFLKEWLDTDPALFQELMRPLVDKAIWDALRTVAHNDRSIAWRQNSGRDDVSGLVAMAERRIASLLDYKLPNSHMRLGDATPDDLRAAIAFHEAQAQGNLKSARFFGMVLTAMGSAAHVRDALNEQRLSRLMASAEQAPAKTIAV